MTGEPILIRSCVDTFPSFKSFLLMNEAASIGYKTPEGFPQLHLSYLS